MAPKEIQACPLVTEASLDRLWYLSLGATGFEPAITCSQMSCRRAGATLKHCEICSSLLRASVESRYFDFNK